MTMRPPQASNQQPRRAHPGTVLKEEFLYPLAMSIDDAAKVANIDGRLLTKIVNRKHPVTGDIATKLAETFDTSAEFWLSMQRNYDKEIANHAAALDQ